MTHEQQLTFPGMDTRPATPPDYVPAGRHETSRRAAVRVASAVSSMKEQILQFISERGERGATDPEISRALRLNPSSARPRRVDLARSGRIILKPGLHTKFDTRAGARVWIVVELLTRRGDVPDMTN